MLEEQTEDESIITSTVEDYLETILVLCEEKGEAQITEIAKSLTPSRSKPSVTEFVTKLRRHGLVHYKKYGTVTLTKKGRKIAQKIKKRHDYLSSFLQMLGVSEDQSEEDACIMEHNLSKETGSRFEAFVRFLQKKEQEDVLKRFTKYLEQTQ
ncbi:MAG: metal-dependent transcriptional regulator [Candidatus Heimdallarchaeota archaeon]|nr:metal-dependent transcriptional regulator [Candidatus Heimdallarchaeota archaeon]